MKKLNCSLIASVFLFTQVCAQDPVFLNTNQSLIYLNPSYAGSNGGIRNQLSFRSQWPDPLSGNQTYLCSFDAYLKALKGGIALTCSSDESSLGLLRTSLFNLSYAQYLSFLNNKIKIIPSVQFGAGVKNFDLAGLHFGDPIDERLGIMWDNFSDVPSPKKNYLDVSAGLLATYKTNWQFGAYLFHLNQPDVGLMGSYMLPARFLTHASYSWLFSQKAQLQLFYRFQQQDNFATHQISANLVLFKYLLTGMSYLSGNAVQLTAGFRSNYFSLQVGYDYVYSKLADNAVGLWEIHAAFFLRDKEHRKALTSFETW